MDMIAALGVGCWMFDVGCFAAVLFRLRRAVDAHQTGGLVSKFQCRWRSSAGVLAREFTGRFARLFFRFWRRDAAKTRRRGRLRHISSVAPE